MRRPALGVRRPRLMQRRLLLLLHPHCLTRACPNPPRLPRRRAWVQIVGEEATRRMRIACIGSTSARAALKLGLPEERIKYPDEPGVGTWAAVVEECLADAAAA